MKAKRSLLNFIASFGSQIILMAFSFVIPRIILVNLGSEVNGFLSSLGQFFVYFNLFSAGIGSATILSLYKFLATKDKESISEVLSASRLYYRKAGRFYLGSVAGLLIIYPLLVKTEIPFSTVFLVILLLGIAGYINFVFMRSIICLLNAEGKDYVVITIGFIIQVLNSVGKIYILIKYKDIVILEIYYLIIIVLQSLIYVLYFRKKYPWVEFKKSPDLSLLSQRNSLMIYQITTLVFLSSGSIILTLFTDLKTVSIFMIFMLISNLLRSVLNSFYQATNFLFGHIFQEGINRYLKFNDAYNTLNITLVSVLFSVAYVLFIPFVKLYTKGITDANYINYNLPFFFCLISIFYLSRTANNSSIMVSGHAKPTAKRSLLEMSINLIVSVVLVQFIGIYGVLIGSLASLIYRSIDMIFYTNLKIFRRSPWRECVTWGTNLLLFGMVVFLAQSVDLNILNYFDFIKWGIVLSFIFFIIFFGVSVLFSRTEYKFIYSHAQNWLLTKYKENYKNK